MASLTLHAFPSRQLQYFYTDLKIVTLLIFYSVTFSHISLCTFSHAPNAYAKQEVLLLPML